jgi:hypothetical protein
MTRPARTAIAAAVASRAFRLVSWETLIHLVSFLNTSLRQRIAELEQAGGR